MIQQYLDELEDIWSLTDAELNHIRLLMALCVRDAAEDPDVTEEAADILQGGDE